MGKTIELKDEVYRRLQAAAFLTGEKEEDVVERLVLDFAKNIFTSEALADKEAARRDAESIESGKVKNRIALWAKRPEQMNHRIIQSFFVCEENGQAPKDAMRVYFVGAGYGNDWQFDNNFSTMCTEEGQSNGKVFACDGLVVKLEEANKEYVEEYREAFLEVLPEDVDALREKALYEIDAQRQKARFIYWFKSLKNNGRPYNRITISSYAGRLEKICADAAFEQVPVDNLFTITDLNVFLEIRDQMQACEGYAQWDEKTHNGISAALSKYEDFLSACELGEIQGGCSDAQRHKWTFEEDLACCKDFLDKYVVQKSGAAVSSLVEKISEEMPEVNQESIRMKVQSIKGLCSEYQLAASAQIKKLSKYSTQCERAFKAAMEELGLGSKKKETTGEEAAAEETAAEEPAAEEILTEDAEVTVQETEPAAETEADETGMVDEDIAKEWEDVTPKATDENE